MTSQAERRLVLRTRLPLYVIGLLIFLQLVQPDPTWTYLLAGFAAFFGLTYFWARGLSNSVEVERQSRGVWVVAGDRLVEEFTLRNGSAWPLVWARIADHSDIPEYTIDRVVACGSHESVQWRTEGLCAHRGVFTVGPWNVTTGDPFGIFHAQLDFPEVRTLLVYPRVMALPDFDLPRGSAGGRARRARSALSQTSLASHVRQYAPGDSLRLIHWRKSAQQDELMVRQFDQEPAGDLWLVLDLDEAVQAGEGEDSTLEYGIIIAASLAAQHLGENRAVGLVALGEQAEIVPPQAGMAHLWRILSVLAHARPGSGWPLARVLDQVRPGIGRGRTLIAITPSLELDWVGSLLRIQHHDIAAAALLLDAASFDGGSDPRLLTLGDVLADHGIPSHVIDSSHIFRPLVPIKRKRTVLKTLSGSGRVVAVEIEEEI
ncbi:MAG: DUF58 domain-containing protein [Caldilineales bacterium]|nr:DUF58 domain-containing protein [Caldilineales bacterium]